MNVTSSVPSLSHLQSFMRELNTVHLSSIKWIKIASETNISIEKQRAAIIFAASDIEPVTNAKNSVDFEIALLRQIRSRTLYCNQIIRKIMKKCIQNEWVNIKLKMRKANRNPAQIKSYKIYLKELIPEKICVAKISLVEQLYIEAFTLLLQIHLELDYELDKGKLIAK